MTYCRWGWHSWSKWEDTDLEYYSYKIMDAMVRSGQKRECTVCGLKQERNI